MSTFSLPPEVVKGGSSSYIPKLIASLGDRVYTGVSIAGIRRDEQGVTVRFADRPEARFDEVVFACHGDQVLSILSDPTDAERDVFRRFRTTTNLACLHTDASLLPARPRARASWNYRLSPDGDRLPVVTYDLNRLQGLSTPEQYCVTLNPSGGIDESKVIRKLVYRHPLYDRGAILAQRRWAEEHRNGRR